MPMLSVQDLKIITRIKEKRGDDVESPGNLENLALRAIVDSVKIYVRQPAEAREMVKKIPPPLVLNALEAIFRDTDEEFDYVCDYADIIFQIFLDERTSSADASKLFCSEVLLSHLSAHCPNLTSFTGNDYDTPCSALLIIAQMKNFCNLQVLMLKGFTLDDEGAMLISHNFPLLRELTIDLDKRFTMVGVEHLATMDHLGRLDLKWKNSVEKTQEAVVMAGTIKNLQTFNLLKWGPESSELYGEFVLLLRAIYPEKELSMDSINLKAPFIWPPNLKVKSANLHLDKHLIDVSLDLVGMIRTDTIGLFVKGRISEAMFYSLMNNLGSKVTELDIGQLERVLKLDLSQVFANCPNLSKFSFHSSVNLEYPFGCKIGPENFAKIYSFDACSNKTALEEQQLSLQNAAVMNRLLKLYVMGSKSCIKLHLRSIDEVKTVMEAMDESPLALSHLTVINVVVHKSNTEDSETVLKFLLSLMRRCDKLEFMRIYSLRESDIRLLKEEFRRVSMYAEIIGIVIIFLTK